MTCVMTVSVSVSVSVSVFVSVFSVSVSVSVSSSVSVSVSVSVSARIGQTEECHPKAGYNNIIRDTCEFVKHWLNPRHFLNNFKRLPKHKDYVAFAAHL